jgi:tripartite ATP-independent transporter DctM subunit
MTLEPLFIGLVGIGVLVILFALGMHIAFAAALVGFLGIVFLKDWNVGIAVIGSIFYGETVRYSFSVIPLFILMGYFAYYAGLTADLFATARTWVGHLPGGLAIATVLGCAGFGAVSGSSTAAAAVMGTVAIPEMKDYGYNGKLVAGVVAASGTLAALIPPSALIVLYAVIVEQSAGACLIAGIFPGIISALIYAGMLYIRVRLNPGLGTPKPPTSWREKAVSLRGIWRIVVLFLFVIGGLYAGVFTPTEAGAVGAFGALCLGLASRRYTWGSFRQALLETGKTTVMIFIVIIGILVFMRLLALSGFTTAVINWLLGLTVPPLVILAGILFVYLFLGMFTTVASMMMLTLPLVFPVIVGLGYDPIWFGIIVIKMGEIALITPPVGLNVYVVNRVAPDIPLQDIFRGILPFLAMDIFTLVLLVAVPGISTFLPGLMVSRG